MSNTPSACLQDLFDDPNSDGLPLADSVVLSNLPAMVVDMSLAEIGFMHILSKCPGLSKAGAAWYAEDKGLPSHQFERIWRIHEASMSMTSRPRTSRSSTPKVPQVGLGETVVERMTIKDGTQVAIMDDFVERMRATYPGVDVEHELRSAARWLEVNPAKRKTLQGLGRFINTWMRNCHDRIKITQTISAAERQSSSPFGVRSARRPDGNAASVAADSNMHLDALIG